MYYSSACQASIKQNELDSKLMSALLVGVVRAFPFAKGRNFGPLINSYIEKTTICNCNLCYMFFEALGFFLGLAHNIIIIVLRLNVPSMLTR